jgi:hypothetical protein
MRIATTVVFALVLALVGATLASAQTPFIAVYFDQNFTQIQTVCPGPGAGTLYVVLANANSLVSGAEYRIGYPAAMTWIGDTNTPPVALGSTPTGISLGFPVPQNGFNSLLLHTVAIFWNCSDCSVTNQKVSVAAHPLNASGNVQFTDWPAFSLVNAIGMDSDVCPTVATEESTWGQVKALYSE